MSNIAVKTVARANYIKKINKKYLIRRFESCIITAARVMYNQKRRERSGINRL